MTAALQLGAVVEPFFLYVCRVNRLLRNGVALPYERVRSELTAVLDDVRAHAQTDARVQRQFELIEIVLIFFADSIMVESPAPWASRWAGERVAAAPPYREVAGDEKFFELLDTCANDTSKDASERLAVFFTCIGLGFSGSFYDQPNLLHHKMQQIGQRLARSDLIVFGQGALFPECYESVNESVLPTPLSTTLTPLLLVLVGLLLAITILFVVGFRQQSDELYTILESMRRLGIVSVGP